ncbi:hypothetical protein [Methylomonas koyamae]|uniref:hypothetical protein n=1 Tax=Methylomonas koyamae TaxID=702114 RepID=UPI0006CF3CFB|nr:hypothetical protein [Methylomonas koyamae]
MNFQGFSPDSFEQFIRALALKVIGPGVTIFGNGPMEGEKLILKGKPVFLHHQKIFGMAMESYKQNSKKNPKQPKKTNNGQNHN